MKKIISLALAALLAVCSIVNVSAALDPKTFKAAKGTPTVDGKLDDAYLAAEEIKIDNVLDNKKLNTSATVRVLWDSKFLYAFFDVVDPVLSTGESSTTGVYERDSVELLVNTTGEDHQDYAGKKILGANQWTAAIVNDLGDRCIWGGGGGEYSDEAIKATAVFKFVKTTNGYAIEMRVPLNQYTPKENDIIGVAFHVNCDEDGKVGREGELFANDATTQTKSYYYTDRFDLLKLTDAVYVAPAPQTTAAPATTAVPTTTAAPATTTAPASTPATADTGMIIAMIAMVSATGIVVISKKKKTF